MDQTLDAHIGVAPAEPDAEVEQMLDLSGIFLLDAAVVGRDDARVHPVLPERFRQRARHVGKAAGLGKRRALRRGQQHLRHFTAPVGFEQGAELFIHDIGLLDETVPFKNMGYRFIQFVIAEKQSVPAWGNAL